MSYGQNKASGLEAIKTITGAPWNGQQNPYPIKSGYENNIFVGDLVYVGGDGYLHNLSELLAANYPTAQAVGVFNGCSFVGSPANSIDFASPGGQYWPAGTVTSNGQDATGFVIDDPSVVFNIQTNGAGLAFNAQGSTYGVSYTYVSGSVTSPTGDFNSGTSSLVLNSSSVNPGLIGYNLRVQRFVPVPGNVPIAGGPAIPFNNVEVLIQNHSFASRPVGTTPA